MAATAQLLATVGAHYTAIAAYSYLIFNLLCAPCFAAIGAIRREMNSAKWTFIAIGYQTLLAYCASLVVYQIGNVLTGGSFGIGTVAAVIIAAVFIYLLVRPAGKAENGRTVKGAMKA